MGKDAIFSGERRCFCYSSCYSDALTQACPILTHCSAPRSIFVLTSASSLWPPLQHPFTTTIDVLWPPQGSCADPCLLPLAGTGTRQTTLLSLTEPLLSMKVQREIYTQTFTGVSTGIQVWLGRVTGSRRKGLTQMGPPATVMPPQAGHPSWHGSQGLRRSAGMVLWFLRFL